MSTTPRRRWSFGLRTLFVVVTVLGSWLGWERRIVSERRIMLERVRNDGGDFQIGDIVTAPGMQWLGNYPEPPSWIRRQFGDEAIGSIDLPMHGREQWDKKNVQALFPEATLD